MLWMNMSAWFFAFFLLLVIVGVSVRGFELLYDQTIQMEHVNVFSVLQHKYSVSTSEGKKNYVFFIFICIFNIQYTMKDMNCKAKSTHLKCKKAMEQRANNKRKISKNKRMQGIDHKTSEQKSKNIAVYCIVVNTGWFPPPYT